MHIRYHIALTLAAAAMLGGCNGSSAAQTGTEEHSTEGKLVDAPVSGVTYRCGSIKSLTDDDGSFTCARFPVEFSVGGVVIGRIDALPDDGIVTPHDLAGVSRDTVDDNVTKLAQFLQSLDDDGVLEKEIKVDAQVRKRLKDVNSTVCDMDEPTLENMLERAGAHTFVSVEDAIIHLQKQMDRLKREKAERKWLDNNSTSPVHHRGSSDSDEKKKNDHHSAYPSNGDTDPHKHAQKRNKEQNSTSAQNQSHGKDASSSKSHIPEDHNSTGSDNEKDVNKSENQTQQDEQSHSDYDAFRSIALEAINVARAEGRTCGQYGYMPAAPSVRWNDHLYASSLEHSRDMALSNTFSHPGSGTNSDITAKVLHPGTGSQVAERIEYNGYGAWQRYGENIAAGTSMDEVDEAMAVWLKSPGHCKNIMNPKFKEVGMALFYHKKSHYRYYWTQDFATAKNR